jgi:Flp pilus assembly protein TadD
MASRRRSRPSPVRWNRGWLLIGAFALSLAVFAPALGGAFIFDDYHLPFADPHAAQMSARFWIGGVRPVLMATYWANFLISGTRPFSYHLVNLFLHAATAVLVFFVFDRLLEISCATAPARSRRVYALFGAAIFLLHPLQTESVAYIAGRSEIVAAFFVFAAWLVFLRFFELATTFKTASMILLLAAAAVLSKESAISVPAILIATDLFWAKDRPAVQIHRRIKLYAPFVLGALAGAVIILKQLAATSGVGASAGVSRFWYAMTECRAIAIYIRLFFFPLGQNGDWQLPFFRAWTAGAWCSLLAMTALIAGIVWLYGRNRLAAFGLTIFLLALAPTSSFVPIKDALAERRMYAPIAGLILAMLALAIPLQLHLGVNARRASAAAIVGMLAFLSFHRSAVWASDASFWRDAAQKNRANSRAYFGLGGALLKSDCAGAIRAFETARSMEPENLEIVWNLGVAHECNKEPDTALSFYRAFAMAKPTANAYDRIAYVEAMRARIPQTMEAIGNALRLDPNDATAYAYRGVAKMTMQDAAGADEDLRRALALDNNNSAALTGMAMLQASRQ